MIARGPFGCRVRPSFADRGITAMPVTHEPWLVALSVLVAIQGAYVGLSLAVQVGGAAGLRRRLLLAGAAISLGVAVWAMHFVGMLAAHLPFPVDYLVFPTLLSFLVCVIVVGTAVFAATTGPLTPIRLAAGACGMGAGIFTMHYLGMAALHASAAMAHAPAYVAASLAVAIGASGLALWLAAGRGGRPPLLLSATAFGLAISGMHYTAMAGLTLYSHGAPPSGAPAGNGADVGQGTYAPLGGAGAPPRRPARHLPIERDGATHFVAVDTVVAVHANAHYTYIFDGSAKLFCPLAIGDVEARLDTSRFVRVHRSHIVNIERVVGLKRAGDSGLVELAAAERYAVPVSRSRVGSLKSRIGARAGEVAS